MQSLVAAGADLNIQDKVSPMGTFFLFLFCCCFFSKPRVCVIVCVCVCVCLFSLQSTNVIIIIRLMLILQLCFLFSLLLFFNLFFPFFHSYITLIIMMVNEMIVLKTNTTLINMATIAVIYHHD